MSVSDSAQRIADVLAPAPPSTRCGWRWGTVTKVNADGTMDVTIGGNTLPSVRALSSALDAKVGDRVRVDYLGTDAVVAGIRAADNRPLLMRGLGSNPVKTTATDTQATWAALGTGLSYYNTTGQLNGKPAQYGLMLNMTNGYDVGQIWKEQRDGGLYIRGANKQLGFAGWHLIPYVTVFYAASGKATITLYKDVRHLLVSAHNSIANLNGLALVTGSTVFKLAGAGGVTYSRSGLTITATSSGNPAYYLLPLE